MLREEMWRYEQITGESAEHLPIVRLGAFLDGYDAAVKEQETILDKITEEIQALRGCSCWDSDGIIDDVEDIIDKYRPESEV